MNFQPSEYQKKIFDCIVEENCSLAIQARAGSSKTTTIVHALELIPKSKKVIFLAFNKHISQEIQTRVPSYVDVFTLHKYGYVMIRNHYGSKIKVNEEKSFWLAVKMFEKNKWNSEGEPKFPYAYRVSSLMNFMRLHMVYEEDDEIFRISEKHSIQIFSNEVLHAKELLKASDKAAYQEIDFYDMLHIPIIKNFKFKKYDFVFVDEAQDLSKVQQEMVKRLRNPISGRLISVMDKQQSIYSFAGADSDSCERMMNLVPNTKQLMLPICYRCDSSIVKEAQFYVPDILPAPNAKKGIVREGTWNEIKAEKCFVLCRNTKPLVQLLVLLLGKGIKANIKGKEIGKDIINLIDKTKQKTVERLLKHLEVLKVKLAIKLKQKNVKKPENHESMIALNEKCDIIAIMAQQFTTVKQLKDYINNVFLDEEVPGVLLSTVHRTKGLECNKVYFLNPELIPSKYARTAEEKEQEFHISYVAITRAKNELIYIRHFGD